MIYSRQKTIWLFGNSNEILYFCTRIFNGLLRAVALAMTGNA